MKRSILIALAIAAVSGLWILSGQFKDEAADKLDTAEENVTENGEVTTDDSRPRVRIIESVAISHDRELTLFGRSEADRVIVVRAATDGHVEEIVSDKGSIVQQSAKIIRLQMDDRYAKLKEAEAAVEYREIAYDAAQALAKKKFSAEVTVAGDQAALETAKADLRSIRLDISRTQITAPFSGIIEESPVEVGDYVQIGDAVSTIVDLDPIIVATEVTERQISQVQIGHAAHVEFANGHKQAGTVTFISRSANDETRTFRVEVGIANNEYIIPRGITAEVSLLTESVMAHRISPSILTLGDNGRIGVKVVNEENSVTFMPISIVDETADGVWIAGLPQIVRLITVGQEFVQVDQMVDAVMTVDP